jgi:hypothetical protein
MQAVAVRPDGDAVVTVADEFYRWLRKTSEPASSEDERLAPNHIAGAGSETTSPAAGPASTVVSAAEAGAATNGAETPAGDDRGGQELGEGSCPPHDLDLDVAPKAMRYPCRKCGFWVKPTMAAEEAEEAAK